MQTSLAIGAIDEPKRFDQSGATETAPSRRLPGCSAESGQSVFRLLSEVVEEDDRLIDRDSAAA
ncbi:hypothetical protein C5D36_09800 [Rathayibacter sp. AY1C6]|nr:hypothetical protein C5D36_09800 [Rathayibacter sp. AY1C6]PPG28160.1 hypothetical protein C5C25_12745 [Rathayibacter sp. AY2B9]